MPAATNVTVNILDKEYRVNCKEDEREGLEKSARYLHQKMNEIRQSGRIIGLDRIAVMAGLNITHDLISENEATTGSSTDVIDRITALQNKLDFAINTFKK